MIEIKPASTIQVIREVPDEGGIEVLLLEHKWLSPKAALQALYQNQIFLLPPTFITLQRIIDCKNYKEVITEWKRSEPSFVNPVIAIDNYTVHCMYTGDAGYKKGDFAIEGPRHRLVVNYKDASFEFLHENCDTFPVNGGKHTVKES